MKVILKQFGQENPDKDYYVRGYFNENNQLEVNVHLSDDKILPRFLFKNIHDEDGAGLAFDIVFSFVESFHSILQEHEKELEGITFDSYHSRIILNLNGKGTRPLEKHEKAIFVNPVSADAHQLKEFFQTKIFPTKKLYAQKIA